MSRQPITIIGAGVAGLTLGRCLKQRGIPTVLYEKAAAHPRYNYGITLQSWAYRPLLKKLEIDESTFCRQTAVDGADGVGRVEHNSRPTCSESSAVSFFAHRGTLDGFLSQGLDIRYEHLLKDISLAQNGVSLSFENGRTLQASLVISADGVHSQVRKALAPHAQLSVLPCVVFNGKRRIEKGRFQAIYAPHFRETTSIKTRKNGVLLQISISNYAKEDAVDISYTYSRLPHPHDALHNPARSNASATDIPEAFFTELGDLQNLEQPFAETFDVPKLRGDRLLHWLMRSLTMDATDLEKLAGYGIVMIGDAAHAQPILGGRGANAAMRDAVELADFIARHGADAVCAVATFYKSGRYRGWKAGVAESEAALLRMHEGQEGTAML